MGIQDLTKLIAENAPNAIKENQISNYFGRKIAIDASMALYQFLIAVRPDETGSFTLTNDIGEETSHLMGMFYRTIRMMDNGIKPVFVFDGKPPTLKSGELARRGQKRKEAEEAKAEAKEEGDKELLAKMNKRTVRVTQKHNEEAKKLLRLMGVPVIEAPCEAEAQCAALVRAQKCYAMASEDMDALTFGSPLLLRHMTYSEARKMPIREIHLQKVLDGLGISMDSFIDLCILLGCDYCDTIKGIGRKRALEQIKKYKNIETILEHLDTTKHPVPEFFPYQEIRELFKSPEVIDPETIELKWSEPKEDELIEFLVKEKGFSEDRVRKGIEKLKKAKNTSVQGRITSFFTPQASSSATSKSGESSDSAKSSTSSSSSTSGSAKKASASSPKKSASSQTKKKK